MSDQTLTEQQTVHRYLKSLAKYLARLDVDAANEVIREIESHIYDALEAQTRSGQPCEIDAILVGLGEPRVLAQGYVGHILDGAPPPSGFNAIQKVKRGATRGLYYAMGLFGYGASASLLAVGIAKSFMPKRLGVWLAEHGNSIIISFSQDDQSASNEILGYWLVPLSILLGLALGYLTKRVLSVLKQRL